MTVLLPHIVAAAAAVGTVGAFAYLVLSLLRRALAESRRLSESAHYGDYPPEFDTAYSSDTKSRAAHHNGKEVQ